MEKYTELIKVSKYMQNLTTDEFVRDATNLEYFTIEMQYFWEKNEDKVLITPAYAKVLKMPKNERFAKYGDFAEYFINYYRLYQENLI